MPRARRRFLPRLPKNGSVIGTMNLGLPFMPLLGCNTNLDFETLRFRSRAVLTGDVCHDVSNAVSVLLLPSPGEREFLVGGTRAGSVSPVGFGKKDQNAVDDLVREPQFLKNFSPAGVCWLASIFGTPSRWRLPASHPGSTCLSAAPRLTSSAMQLARSRRWRIQLECAGVTADLRYRGAQRHNR